MEDIIKVEFTTKMDKSIYEKSPWKTKEEFFNVVVINHVDADLNFFKRDLKNMKGETKEHYKIFIKCLEEMKKSINNSIHFDVLDINNNIEDVKISFSFKYYETPVISAERTVEGYIFIVPIQEISIAVEELERVKLIPGIIKDEEREIVENSIKLLNYAVNFMEEAKSTLIVTKNGVDLGNIFDATKQKLKM